ncbi:hypothetical protein PUR49_00510 [Streptomyces sp. BE147]|uniref:hypothetical protein n=1 Tax=Streptomyces sp. BE147 TaxID=3002524 RepID=UPI002E76F7B7|nr:hypothetical protein [Streptomyces sp. BE147]MEE1735053.1 hypothetical protein [Streptomyces sp. BE147]
MALLITEALTRRLGRRLMPADIGLIGLPLPIGVRPTIVPPAIYLDRLPYQLAPQFAPISSRLGSVARQGEAYKAGKAEVACLNTTADLAAQFINHFGGGYAEAALSTFLADTVAVWLQAPASATVRSDIQAGAARIFFILARMKIDQQKNGPAQYYLDTAQQLATEATDRSTLAIVLRTQSTQAATLGHGSTAFDLAEAAHSTAARTPDPVKGYALAQLGVAHAARSEAHAALSAIDTAQELAARTGHPPGPFTSYAPSALYYQRARVMRHLGDHAATVTALNSSLRHRSPTDLRGLALCTAALASLHLEVGHLDQACARWSDFLNIYPRLRSTVADSALTQLRQRLSPHRRHHAAAQLLDRATQLDR